MNKISAVILTKNEENNIVDCIESVLWCDEIIVIDDNSTDNTLELAKKQKASVYKNSLNNNFAAQRNFALSKAKGDWVLFVDADERVSESLQKEIKETISTSLVEGYYIQRIDTMWGKVLRHGEMGSMWILRLGKKGSGKWEGDVHEEWKIKGTIGNLRNFFVHYPHQTIREFLAEVNFYSTLRAHELYKKEVHVSWFDVILYPKAKFIVNYIFKLGFLDGTEGFIVAMMMSFYSFLVRGKLWQLWRENSKV